MVNGQRSWFQNVPLLKSDIAGTPQFTLEPRQRPDAPLTQGNEIAARARR